MPSEREVLILTDKLIAKAESNAGDAGVARKILGELYAKVQAVVAPIEHAPEMVRRMEQPEQAPETLNYKSPTVTSSPSPCQPEGPDSPPEATSGEKPESPD